MTDLTFDHLVLVAEDVTTTLRFYRRVLGATVADEDAWRAGTAPYPVLHFGGWKVNVHPAGGDVDLVARRPGPGSLDVCLVWPGPIAGAQAHLASMGVALELGPIRQVGAQGLGASVYFRDPDGNLLELISYDAASAAEAPEYA